METTATSAAVRTFLIADIRGYTSFTLERGDEAAARLTAHFAALAQEVVATRGGQVIELRGDEALAVFSSPRQALRAAIELQDRFAREMEEDPSMPLAVGIGLDAGEAIPVGGGYRGGALNLAARLCTLAGAGEVLASEGVAHLARRTEGLAYVERGTVELKGFADPVTVVRVVPERAPDDAVTRSPMPAERPATSPRAQRLPIGGFLGSLPAGTLVGRDEELGQILQLADAVAAGEGRLTLLAGEPGAGKTRLAQEVTLHARNRGFLVAAGSCFEPRQTVPYYPFLDVLATLYGVAPSAIRSQAAQRWPYLARLLPEVGTSAPVEPGGQEEQERLFRAFTRFIQAISETTSVAIFLDDLHWADGASLDLLQHLARHTRGDRVLLLGTYRDVEVGRQHPLERALVDLGRQALVERIAVRRLGQEGTAALVAAILGEAEVSDEFAQLIQHRTDGNPFFVQEVLRALVERGDVYREDGRWERRTLAEIEVPESVRAAIGQRLSRLSDATQSILHEASVLGQTFDFDDLKALGNHSDEDMEEALEEATAAGLTRVGERETYAFNHALTQQALYAELSPRRKRRLHLAAGEALERLPERVRQKRVAELAWHFLQGDDAEQSLPYTLLAGDQATAVLGYREAVGQYRAAAELARELDDPVREAAALEKVGLILNQLLRYDEAIEALERAERLYREADNREAESRVVVAIARAYGGKAKYEQALARLETLFRSHEASPPSASLAIAYRTRAEIFLWSRHPEEALAATQPAIEAASAVGDELTLLQAQTVRGIALSWLGREPQAMAEFEELLPRAEALGDLQILSRALTNLGDSCLRRGWFDRARVYWERSFALVTRSDIDNPAALETANLSELHFFLGDWERARAYAARSVEIAQPLDLPWYYFWPLCMLGRLCLVQGEWDSASRHLEECVQIARDINRLVELGWAQNGLAELDLLQDYPDRAVGRLEPLLDRARREGQDVTIMLPTLACAYLDRGDAGRAQETVKSAIERATTQENRLVLADALRVQGMVLTRQHRWNEADAVFDEAVFLTRSMPYPYAEARAHYEYGMLHREQGELEPARKQLEEALAIFQRLRARKNVERTEQALGQLS